MVSAGAVTPTMLRPPGGEDARFTITLSLQPPPPPAELDITYHRALHHELIDLSHQRQPPASLSRGLYRLRTVQAGSAQLALERARALVAAAAASRCPTRCS